MTKMVFKKGEHPNPKAEFRRGHGRNKLSENPMWNGGITTMSGYIMIKKRDHPFATSKGYVMKHRLVMEEHLGRYLTKDEVVHHINGNKTDNRIENLQLFNNDNEHVKHHRDVEQKYYKLVSKIHKLIEEFDGIESYTYEYVTEKLKFLLEDKMAHDITFEDENGAV